MIGPLNDRRNRIRTSAAIQQRARALRQATTPAEKLLWSHLRNRQLSGLKFRRQHPLGPFIADFYCAEQRLVVEIDGGIHAVQSERDEARTEQFEQYGYRVIRFRNEQVLNDVESALAAIEAVCLPSPRARRENEATAQNAAAPVDSRDSPEEQS